MGEPFLREHLPERNDQASLNVEKLYQHRFSAQAKLAKERVWRVIVRHFFQHWIHPGDTVLDLGCGYGEFLNHLRCRRRIGVDVNPDSVAHLSDTVEFHQGDVTNLGFLPPQSVHAVFTSNMLEHLPAKSDVERLLLEVHRVLVPGGHFIAMGPNMRCLHGRYWDFWDHNVAITDRSLAEVLEYLDFEIVDAFPRFLPYTTQSWYPQAPFFVKLYLRAPIAWRVLGKQFLLRARKPVNSPNAA